MSDSEHKTKFTPELLLGVETTLGYIKDVWITTMTFTPRTFINTTECRNLHVSEVEYYISDESDETVSFTEYVEMFYDGWCNEYVK